MIIALNAQGMMELDLIIVIQCCLDLCMIKVMMNILRRRVHTIQILISIYQAWIISSKKSLSIMSPVGKNERGQNTSWRVCLPLGQISLKAVSSSMLHSVRTQKLKVA